MHVPATLLVGSTLVINAADTVPRYDVKSTCRAAISLSGTGTEGRTVENCISSEERARKELEKDWSKIPSAERTQCIASMAKGGFPSYVELVICLEIDERFARAPRGRARKNANQRAKGPDQRRGRRG